MGIENVGSVDDVRCSLRFMNPETNAKRDSMIRDLEQSIERLQSSKESKTKQKMIQAKINQLRKLSLPK